MATKTVNGLPQIASPVATDKVSGWDTSAGTSGYIEVGDLITTAVTGGGTVATGGYTLTVPATGTAALRDSANTFTSGQSFDPTNTAQVAIDIDMPASTSVYALQASYNGTLYQYARSQSVSNQYVLNPTDLGNDVAGGSLVIGNNTSAGTEGGAAGTVRFFMGDSNVRYSWVDGSGNLRIHTSPPRGNTGSPTTPDTAGTVVGTQTSNAVFKTVIGTGSTASQALGYIRDAVSGMARFTYKSGAYNGQEFDGIILRNDEQAGLARYGMDADEDHTAGKSLNLINAISDLMRVVADQALRIEQLEESLSND